MHAAPAACNQALPLFAELSCASSAADRRVDGVATRRPTYGFGNRHFGAFDGQTGGPPPPAPPAATPCTRFLARTHTRPHVHARARVRHRAGWGGDVAEVTDLAAPDTTEASERRALRLQAMRRAFPRTTDNVHHETGTRDMRRRDMPRVAQRGMAQSRNQSHVARRRTARAATHNQTCGEPLCCVAPARAHARMHARRQRRRSLTRSTSWPTLSSPTR